MDTPTPSEKMGPKKETTNGSEFNSVSCHFAPITRSEGCLLPNNERSLFVVHLSFTSEDSLEKGLESTLLLSDAEPTALAEMSAANRIGNCKVMTYNSVVVVYLQNNF